MKSLLLILNPIAGKGIAKKVEHAIGESGLNEQFQVQIQYTKYSGHAAEIAEKAVQEKIDVVVAAGGDGTVNEVASRLVHSNTALGIIPIGSGNGLARHMGYSMQIKKCLQQIAVSKIEKIDTLLINNRFGVNVSGFGFDGFVAWKFNKEGKRGLSNYTKIALREYAKYQPIHFELEGLPLLNFSNAHMLVIANASQFGNAAIIAPTAQLTDGLMDVVLVRKPSPLQLPSMFYRLFTGKLKDADYIQSFKCNQFSATSDRAIHLHVDGEACEPITKINVVLQPKSLLVIDPK
ncbi:MAG: diacylglycerol kinase family lipid kinase [Bacteroidetes bacterium]|nr:diacylglycerol kinase family lipid kinase [Bacteroidota bacterium]